MNLNPAYLENELEKVATVAAVVAAGVAEDPDDSALLLVPEETGS